MSGISPRQFLRFKQSRIFILSLLIMSCSLTSHAAITINSASGAHWSNTGNGNNSISLTSLFPLETASVLNGFSSTDSNNAPTSVTVNSNYLSLMQNCRTFTSPTTCAGVIAFGRVLRAGVPESQAAMNRMVVLDGSGRKRYVDISVRNGSVSFDASQIHDTEIAFLDVAYYRGEKDSPFHRCDSETVICGSKVPGCPVAPANATCFSLVSTPSGPSTCVMNLAIDTLTQPSSTTAADGKIAVSASGAVGPVTYTISPPASQNGGTFDQLSAPATYTIVANDTTNSVPCTRTLPVHLTVSSGGGGGPTPTPSSGNCSCYGSETIFGTWMAGQANAPPQGGINSYSRCIYGGYRFSPQGGVCVYIHYIKSTASDWYAVPFDASINANACQTFENIYGTPARPICP